MGNKGACGSLVRPDHGVLVLNEGLEQPKAVTVPLSYVEFV